MFLNGDNDGYEEETSIADESRYMQYCQKDVASSEWVHLRPRGDNNRLYFVNAMAMLISGEQNALNNVELWCVAVDNSLIMYWTPQYKCNRKLIATHS